MFNLLALTYEKRNMFRFAFLLAGLDHISINIISNTRLPFRDAFMYWSEYYVIIIINCLRYTLF